MTLLKKFPFSKLSFSLSCIFYFILLVIPIFLIFFQSVWNKNFTLKYYNEIFTDFTYIKILLNTLRISLIVTILCSLLSYPIALSLNKLRGKKLKIAYLVFSLPLLINPLTLVYSWMVILQNKGVVNYFLIDFLGIITYPVQLLYNSFGVTVTMLYMLLPYSVFLVYYNIHSIEKKYYDAALNMGAHKFQIFKWITLPLSIPGLLVGLAITFILSIGYFVVPSLLGGLNQTMISMIIEQRINTYGSWGIASALVMLILFSVSIMILILLKLIRGNKVVSKQFNLND